VLLVEGVLIEAPARRSALAALILLAPALAAAVEFDEFPDDPSAWTTRIDARKLDDRFATVEDALERAPGVDVRRYGGLGSYSTASVRGSKPEQVLVLLDGVRLDAGSRGAVDLSAIPLRSVETIEVVRGGGAGRYGSDAVGGIISITSRRPDGEVALDASGTSGELGTLGADALLTGGRGAASGLVGYTRLSGDNDFRFERSFEHVSGSPLFRLRPEERFTRRNADFVQDTGLARLLLDTGEQSDLEATLELHDSERGQPGSIYRDPRPGLSDEQVSCPLPEEDFRRALVNLDWGHASVAGGALALQGFHRVEESALRDPEGRCGLVVPLARGGMERVERTDSETGASATWSSRPLSLGAVGLRSRASAELRRDDVRGDETAPAERWTTNVFLLEELRLLSGALRIFPSLGLDLAHSPSVTTSVPGLPGAEQEVSAGDGGEWIPKLGAIARLAPGLRLRANYGRAFRRPSFRELFMPDFGYVRGNPNLEPEDGTNLDVGVELRPRDLGPLRALAFEAVWFDAALDEGIELVQVNAFTSSPQNVGKTRARGWEVSGAASLFERLDLSASYTFQDSEIESAPGGPPLPHRPRNSLYARAGARAGAGSAWLETRYEDSVTLTTTGRIAADPVWQLDLGVSVELSELPGLAWVPGGLELSSQWQNLTAADRIDSLGFPLPGRVWYLRLRSRTSFSRSER
jgi:iron complex outermembrane receptor protein